jgi:transposase InsO family protein
VACAKVELSRQNRKAGATLFAMNKITQATQYRQALILYAEKYGVTKAAIRYQTNRQYIYRWRKRYDGTLQSLCDRSHRPHSHPNQHRIDEITLINNMRRRNPNDGIVVFWVKLRQRGYKRSISGLYRFLRKRNQMAVKQPNPKYIPKAYEQMQYPGQRVQIDVKYVPAVCLVGEAVEDAGENGGFYYQYTFIDEYSRFRYLEAFKEHSSYSSAEFIKHCVEKFPYAIECVQTDNGPEFTSRFSSNAAKRLSLFETTLSQLSIRHKLIRPFTPRHNGKVERSHRKDNEYFYASHKFFSFCDFQNQLAVWNRKYNAFPMRPLNWSSPKQVLRSFPNSVTHH